MLLTIQSLGCERDGRVLFDGFDLTIESGECVELTGPNGSGKTTLIRAVAGLFPDVTGKIEHGGVEYLGHKAGVSTVLNPLENLRWYRSISGIGGADPLTLLETVGLGGFQYVPCAQLSAGQQRRVALARLGMSEHPLWLLDEPFTALDSEGQALVRKLISEHIAAGGGALCATHQPLGIAGARPLALGASG